MGCLLFQAIIGHLWLSMTKQAMQFDDHAAPSLATLCVGARFSRPQRSHGRYGSHGYHCQHRGRENRAPTGDDHDNTMVGVESMLVCLYNQQTYRLTGGTL